MLATYISTPSAPAVNKGAVMSATTTIRPPLNEIVRKVRALRALSKSTGFSTNRTVGELLEKLSPDDLVRVGEAFLLSPNDTSDDK